MKPRRKRSPIEPSSGSVFSDLNLPDAAALDAKARKLAKGRLGPDVAMLRAFKRLQLRPGDIYESCGFHPILCLGVDYKQDDVWGISLIDGSYPHSCSLVLCGVRRLSLKQARDIKLRGPESPEDRTRIAPTRRWWVEGADPSPLRISFTRPRGMIASDLRATAAGMYRSGTIAKKTFREFDALTRPEAGSTRRRRKTARGKQS